MNKYLNNTKWRIDASGAINKLIQFYESLDGEANGDEAEYSAQHKDDCPLCVKFWANRKDMDGVCNSCPWIVIENIKPSSIVPCYDIGVCKTLVKDRLTRLYRWKTKIEDIENESKYD